MLPVEDNKYGKAGNWSVAPDPQRCQFVVNGFTCLCTEAEYQLQYAESPVL